MIRLFCLVSVLVIANISHAGECKITTTRYACPGHEAESYSKCNGLQTCAASTTVASLSDCAALALSGCANARFQVTQYKVVTALYDGAAVANGSDFCDKDATGYIVHANFPYRGQPTCN